MVYLELAQDAGFVRQFPTGVLAAQFLLHYPGTPVVLRWWKG